MESLPLFGLILSAVLIGAGILLVIAAFIVHALAEAKKAEVDLRTDIFDVLLELAKRAPVLFIPGLLMIGFGVVLAGIIIAGPGAFGGPPPTPSSSST